MPDNGPDFNIEITTLQGCTGLQLIDATGFYPEKPFGYDAPTGVEIEDVTSVTITLYYSSMSTSTIYVFTLNDGEITAATLSLGGVSPVNIFGSLTTFEWPFTSENPFELTKNYGVTLPEFADDVYKITYTVASTGDDYEFSSVVYYPVGCNIKCCIDKKWQAIDPSCSCCSDKMNKALYLESLYNQFYYSCVAGNLTQALQALREAKRECGQTTGGCGC